jgi:hypothetical protein
MAERDLEELKAQVDIISIEHAARQPIENLVRILMYFLVGISIFLGLFGVTQFSDIENKLEEKVALQFAKDESKVLAYKNAVDDLREAHAAYMELTSDYDDALRNLGYLRDVDDTIDIEPTVHRLSNEEDNYAADPSLPGFDSWRLEALTTLEVFLQTSQERNFDPDLLFNASQMAARLKNRHLSLLLIKEANRRRPLDTSIQAAVYSGLIDSGTPDEVEKSYKELMGLVPQVVRSITPHILLAEAWNAAVDLGRFADYLQVLESIDQRADDHVPSVLYAMKARVLLQVPNPDNLEKVRQAISQAKQQLAAETVSNLWVGKTLKYISDVETSIRITEQIRAETAMQQMPSSL